MCGEGHVVPDLIVGAQWMHLGNAGFLPSRSRMSPRQVTAQSLVCTGKIWRWWHEMARKFVTSLQRFDGQGLLFG